MTSPKQVVCFEPVSFRQIQFNWSLSIIWCYSMFYMVICVCHNQCGLNGCNYTDCSDGLCTKSASQLSLGFLLSYRLRLFPRVDWLSSVNVCFDYLLWWRTRKNAFSWRASGRNWCRFSRRWPFISSCSFRKTIHRCWPCSSNACRSPVSSSLCSCTEWASATSESLILFKCWFYFICLLSFGRCKCTRRSPSRPFVQPWK